MAGVCSSEGAGCTAGAFKELGGEGSTIAVVAASLFVALVAFGLLACVPERVMIESKINSVAKNTGTATQHCKLEQLHL